MNLKDRLKYFVSKMLSVSFLTWLLIFSYLVTNDKGISTEFYGYTVLVLGIKTYKGLKEKV